MLYLVVQHAGRWVLVQAYRDQISCAVEGMWRFCSCTLCRFFYGVSHGKLTIFKIKLKKLNYIFISLYRAIGKRMPSEYTTSLLSHIVLP